MIAALFDVVSQATVVRLVCGLALVAGVLVSWLLSRADVVLHGVETETEPQEEESAADIISRLVEEDK
jgi:hypothetical protein